MDGIVLQHVGEVLGVEQVVDADDFDVIEVLDGGAEDHAADAAKPVDANFDGHVVTPCLLTGGCLACAWIRPDWINKRILHPAWKVKRKSG